jgi:hypothetical protein
MLVSVVKMATVLEACTTDEQRSVVPFFFVGAKDSHKEMFPLYGGKCLVHKAVHKCVEKFSQGLSKITDDARQGAKLLETTLKNFYSPGFDALIMQRNNCINVGGLYVEK